MLAGGRLQNRTLRRLEAVTSETKLSLNGIAANYPAIGAHHSIKAHCMQIFQDQIRRLFRFREVWACWLHLASQNMLFEEMTN